MINSKTITFQNYFKYKAFLLCFISLVAINLKVLAQAKPAPVKQITLVGTTTNDKDEYLQGVDVREKGTNNHVLSDALGAFTIKVSPGATLVFSYVSCVEQEMKITGAARLNIKMETQVRALNEVIVVGYGQKKKSSFTGSAVTLDAKELNKASMSVGNLLQGKASGVQVFQDNATPGAGLSIRIRGTNSINASSDPLYVVDGFPLSDNIGFSMNPDDIESITILKDAASTSIYGARGANGVVMITTKSGFNKPAKVTLAASHGEQNPSGRYDLIGPYDNAVRLNALETLRGNIPPYGSGRLDSLQKGLLGTDWQKQAYNKATVDNYSLSFVGGSKKTSVFSSLNYLDQKGIVINTLYKRIGGRLNVEQEISDKIKISGRVFVNYGLQDALPLNPSTINGFLKQVLKANPSSTFDGDSYRDAQNPLHFIAAVKQNNSFFRTQGYFSTQYKIIKGLTLKADIGADINKDRYLYFAPSSIPAGVSTKGLASTTDIETHDLLFNPTLNYVFNVTKNNNFVILLGYNRQKESYWEEDVTATNFGSDNLGYYSLNAAQQFSASSVKTVNNRQSWFGRLDYDYGGKYIFSGTYRIDGSSVFADNHKLGYFPSAAVAWNFKKEKFGQNATYLSAGKARLSYGVTGNDRINSGSSLATYSTDKSTSYTFDGTSTVSGIAVTSLTNSELQWEKTKALDAGIDLGFFKDRLLFEFDYYEKKTSDLLLAKNIAPSSGFLTKLGNEGSMQNNGFEIAINTTNIVTPKLKWTTGITYAINKNKVLSLGDNNSDIYLGSFKPDGAANFEDAFIIRTDQTIGAIYGYQYNGIIQTGDPVLTTTQPNSKPGDPKVVDTNKDGVINASDRVILGVGIPNVVAGFNTSVSFKGFTLDVVLQGQFGGKLVNVQKEDLQNPISFQNQEKSVLTNVWSTTNTSGTIPARGWYGNPYGGFVNSNFVESSDYVKLRNVTLGYNVPARFLKKLRMSSVNAYINAQNILTFTKYTGIDPEVGNYRNNGAIGKNATRGLDFNAYPNVKIVTVGFNISFN
ncbi:MAG TPA: TonB-dependent receptor [Hanamia sp.]